LCVNGEVNGICVTGESRGVHLGLYSPDELDLTLVSSILTVNRTCGSGKAVPYATWRKVLEAAAVELQRFAENAS